MTRKRPLACGALALLCVALAWLPDGANSALEFDRSAIFNGELWRLWSGHLVHFSARHALVDAGVFFLLGSVVELEIGTRRLALALACAAPAISIGLLLLTPDLAQYRGASALAMAMAVAAGIALWPASSAHRIALVVLALALVLKTVAEIAGGSVHLAGLPPDAVVAWQAHVFGALCGWALMRVPAHVTKAVARG